MKMEELPYKGPQGGDQKGSEGGEKLPVSLSGSGAGEGGDGPEGTAGDSSLSGSARPREGWDEAPRPGNSGDTLRRLWDLYWDTFQHRYWKTDGRAGRTEFWTFFFGAVIGDFVLKALGVLPLIGFVAALASLAWVVVMFVPVTTAAIRRLHDTGRSGWWAAAPAICSAVTLCFLFMPPFLTLIGLAALPPMSVISGAFVLVTMIFCAFQGTRGPNRWGEEPADPGIF
ncbi:MAG: DUF805 domain-containing protein [Sutterellaceae bacterium]|nr:DUF805 domain-containing protein [Sutterellaceae bacterium]MDD7442368.1 DUF805 domain-containing protein [Sutterellaceae bacterium]